MFVLQFVKVFVIFLLVHYTNSVDQRKCDACNSSKRPSLHFPLRNSSHVNSIPNCEERYLVPVAWHVIMNRKRDGYVSEKTIKDAMKVLNDGFNDTILRFRLHSFHVWTNDTWSKFDCVKEKSTFMSALSISPATVLNVYTCPYDYNRFKYIGSTAFPWCFAEDSACHGVIIHPESLPNGSIKNMNEGKNLIREVGHYFGLLDYFENLSCDGDGDYVDDTPISSEATYDCPNNIPDSCPGQSGLDPIHNYMGFADDSCMYEFTPGQKERMSWILKKFKPSLMSIVHRPCNIDSVFRWINGFVYFFSGESYYRYNETSHAIDTDYPRPINEHWRGVPNYIDGVFRYSNGITYFFKGSYYYRFNDTSLQVDPGYPRNISDFWRGIPSNIDDVIRYSNGHTYFFKNDLYYRFNSTTASVDVGYPKRIQTYWTGIPDKVHAAFTWYNGGVYFFKDAEFWLFIPRVEVNEIKLLWPRSIKIWWKDREQLTGYSVFRRCNGYTYFLLDYKYWRYNDLECSVDFTYPHLLSGWYNFSRQIDGIFVWSNNYLYVFSGNLYYRFNQTSQKVSQGYPKQIASYWQGVPDNIDAVFRSSNGLTYFFKGFYYYRFNDFKRQLETGYPKPISSFWKGVPSNLDTVFCWSNDQTYFFKGNYYYRFNYTKGAVDDGYPRHVPAAWRGVLYNP